MKLVQNLPEIFEEFGEQRRKAFLDVKEYKDKGIPVIGMYCAYFPTELAMAVGAIPVGLCSFSNETVPAAERELPKSMCPLVKSSYGFAKEDKCPFFHFADLVIGETTCDGKKKMYELMAEFKPVHVMELPNSQSEKGLKFWKQEVIETKEFLEEFFHIVITEKMIRDAVHLNNEIRTSLKQLCEVMKLDPAPILGEEIQKMVTGSKYRFDFHTTPDVVNSVTAKILEEYQQGKKLDYRPRILVTGCPVGGDSMKVIHEIENNGGVVVAVENCSGVRTLSRMVDEEQKDIYEAIARKYLSTGCSIMTPNDNRIELLGEIIDEYHVDGVVEVILTGCHSTGAESIYIRKFVNEEKKIPYIAIDTDYSSADIGRISTRLAAFLEMIQCEKTGEKKLDINYCYKVVLSGITKGNSMENILEELWEYAGIPLCLEDKELDRKIQVGMHLEEQYSEEIKMIEKPLPENRGKVKAIIPQGRKRTEISELCDIIVKSYQMKKNTALEVKEENIKTECPDYLWILSDNQKETESLYKELVSKRDFLLNMQIGDDQSILLSNLRGKEHRNQLIAICKEYMKNKEGKLLIGNGFHEDGKKEKNKQLQQYVFKLAFKKNPKEKVYLIENYYHELALNFISENITEDDFSLEELECIRKEEKGKDLYDTLYWYLRMKRNVAQTAARLKIHRNTLLPRIARINELINIDEKDGMECEKLLLVMEMKMFKEESKTD